MVLNGLIFLGIGGLLLYGGFRTLNQNRLIADTPTSKARSAAVGLVELKGKATGKTHLIGPLSKKKCLYYHYVEYELKLVRSGKSSSLQWVEKNRQTKCELIYVEDDSGSIPVNIEDTVAGEIDLKPRLSYCQRTPKHTFWDRLRGKPKPIQLDMEKITAGDMSVNGFNTGDRKYTEYSIQPGDNLYVLGTLGLKGVVGRGAQGNEFIITDKSESEKLKDVKKQALTLGIIGAILILIGAAVVLAEFAG